MRTLLFLLALGLGFLQAGEITLTATLPAAEARQAAVADARYAYAIDSKTIAQYDRATGARVAVSTGPASHLNSGAWWAGTILCAHSNYPHRPEQSEVRVLDPATMQLSLFKDLGAGHGSLVWVVREGEHWWCGFAHYGAENARSVAVKYTAEWQELGAWHYPPEVIARLGKMSISGAVWKGGQLLAIGHDAREVYCLRLPVTGETLELMDILPAPFPGQGISLELGTGQLVGVDRGQKAIIFGTFKP